MERNPQSELPVQDVADETNSDWTVNSLFLLVGSFSVVLGEGLWMDPRVIHRTDSADLLGHSLSVVISGMGCRRFVGFVRAHLHDSPVRVASL